MNQLIIPGATVIGVLVVATLTWLACRDYYAERERVDTLKLDALWEIGETQGWPGRFGRSAFRILDFPYDDPLPDAAHDPEAAPEPVPPPRNGYDTQWAAQGRVPDPAPIPAAVTSEDGRDPVADYMAMPDLDNESAEQVQEAADEHMPISEDQPAEDTNV